MQVYRLESRPVEVVDKIICNKCGKEIKSDSYGGALIGAQVSGGYDSTFMEDGAQYTFDLCEECVVELMKTFKHSAFQFCIQGCEHHISK